MVQSVFERKEVKYIITAEQRRMMLDAMQGYMKPDQYGETTICNIYFDTDDNRIVRESIEKPLYKEKLRLRTYGVPSADSPAFIELKKKYEGIVYKRRETLPYAEAYAFLTERKRPSRDSQIMKEIDWTLGFYPGLAPAMALFYERVAYMGCEDPELRMTLDTRLRYRKDDLDLAMGSHGRMLMDDSMYIMEIKISEAMPLWMSAIMDRCKIFPGSYSKYGTAYTQDLIEGRNII